MPCACVAAVGPQNEPIFMQVQPKAGQGAVDHEDELQLNFVVHAALDVVEERIVKPAQSGGTTQYLGLLYPTEDYIV